MSNYEPEVTTREARYGVRLDYVIFPIDYRELIHALAKNGYELSPARNIPPAPARIRYGGEIARKKESVVVVESDRSELGVVSRTLQEAKSSFEELAKVIESELGFKLYEKVCFYLFSVHYKVDTGKAPREQIPKTENKEFIEKLSKILGEDIVSFSLRIARKKAVPNQESWFDIAIDPDILNEKLYHIGVVFRDPEKDKTEKFVNDLENNLLEIIKKIEA